MARPRQRFIPQDSLFPLKGLNKLTPSTFLHPSFSPEVNNISTIQGRIASRTGYSDLGTQPSASLGAVDSTPAITVGPIQLLVDFEADTGTRYLIASTNRHQLKYSTADDKWENITPLKGAKEAINSIDTGAKTFKIVGDRTDDFKTAGTWLSVTGSTSDPSLNGTYTLAEDSTYAEGDPSLTTIKVNETITSSSIAGAPKIFVHDEWTGDSDESDVVDHCIGADLTLGRILLITNGKDVVRYWDGSSDEFKIAEFDFPGEDSFNSCKTLDIINEHLVMGNITIGGITDQHYIAWSDIGDFMDFSGGTSGSLYIRDAQGDISKILKSGNSLLVFDNGGGLNAITYVGGDVILAYHSVTQNTGLINSRSIVNVGPYLLYASKDNIFLFDGSRMARPIGDAISKDWKEIIDSTTMQEAHAFHDTVKRQVYWVVPVDSLATDHKCFVLEYDVFTIDDLRWTIHTYGTRPSSFSMFARDDSATWGSGSDTSTWADEVGSWSDVNLRSGSPVKVFGTTGGKVFLFDETVRTDEGSAIDCWWDSKDFTVPELYESSFARWLEVELELKGASVDVYYSTDLGQSYTLASTETPSVDWSIHKIPVDTTSRTFRIRLRVDGDQDWFEGRFNRVWLKRAGVR